MGVLIVLLMIASKSAEVRQAEVEREVSQQQAEHQEELQLAVAEQDLTIDVLGRTLARLRSDLTQVALAVGAKPRASNR